MKLGKPGFTPYLNNPSASSPYFRAYWCWSNRSLLTAKSATPVAKLVDWGIRLGLLVKTAPLNAVLRDWRSDSSSGPSKSLAGTKGIAAVDQKPEAISVAASSDAVPVNIAETNCNAGGTMLADDGSSGLVSGHRVVVAAFEHWSEPQRTHLLALFVAHGGPKVGSFGKDFLFTEHISSRRASCRFTYSWVLLPAVGYPSLDLFDYACQTHLSFFSFFYYFASRYGTKFRPLH